VNACLDATSGFCIHATGAGKTFAVAALADVMAQNELRTMVIVPSADLVEQTAGTFRLCLLDVGVYSGAEKDIQHSTVVATWQSLQNNPVLMQDFDCVIVDEAHGVRADVVGKLINVHGKNAAYRFGFTGTMPKPLIDQTTLRGSIGEVLHEVPAALLMEQGYLAKLEIEPIEIDDDLELDEDGKPFEFPDYGAEKTYLARSPRRLDFLADLIIAKAAQYGNTFVLVNSIKQGKELQKLIKDSVFLYGASDNDVRAEWYSMFEERDDLIVIATFGIASVGISIDRIFCEVMVDAGRSFVRVLQSCGRSLRKGHDKDRVHLVDVHSKLKWSRKHFRERNAYYKEAKYPVLKTVKCKL
jgi:superfamily II DNA or RNA helicase